MKTAEQIIEWINNELKKLDKKEERALVNPDIESSIESIDNIYPQKMLLNNLLKYIDGPPQFTIEQAMQKCEDSLKEIRVLK